MSSNCQIWKKISVCVLTSYRMGGLAFILITLFVSVSNLFAFSYAIDDIKISCPKNARTDRHGKLIGDTETSIACNQISSTTSEYHDGEANGCICSDEKPCLSLCCPLGHVRNKLGVCQFEDDGTTPVVFPKVYNDYPTSNETVEVNNENFHLIYSYPCAKGEDFFFDPVKRPYEKYYLMRNGSLIFPDDYKKEYTIFEYCFWRIENFVYLPVACVAGNYTPTRTPTGIELADAGAIVSIAFLIVTFIVYTILPKMNTLHGLTLRGYVATLLSAYIGRVVRRSYTLGRITCLITGYFTLFSFLATFFWLNVMGFDIWHTFGRFQLRNGRFQQSKKKRYIFYCCWAWGLAFLFTIIPAIMDYLPGIPSGILCPTFARRDICWFENEEAAKLYFYGPMSISIICNIFFFTSTACCLHRTAKNTARQFDGEDSEQHNNNKVLWHLYMRLFIIMGITWSAEVILWYNKETAPDFCLHMIIAMNSLHGPIIFVVFICKRDILRQLVKRCRSGKPPIRFTSGNSSDIITDRNNSNRDTCMSSLTQCSQKR